jgi:uncharacterized membrane protein
VRYAIFRGVHNSLIIEICFDGNIFVCVELALFDRVVNGLFKIWWICYVLWFCSGNILLVVFELLVKHLVEPTKNPTSRDSAAQRIDDKFRKGAGARKEI